MGRSNLVPLVAFAFECGLIPLAALLGWLFGIPPFSSLAEGEPGWTDDLLAVGIGLAAALPPLAGLLLSQRTDWGPLRRLRTLVDDEVVPHFAHCSWVEFALISLAAGFGEELLFRGVLQDGLASWLTSGSADSLSAPVNGVPFGLSLGIVLAIAATSLAFGAAHALSLMYAILATVISVYLGLLYVATDNILAPISAHAAYDFLALLLLVRTGKSTHDGGVEQ